jgi:hypothetical protein
LAVFVLQHILTAGFEGFQFQGAPFEQSAGSRELLLEASDPGQLLSALDEVEGEVDCEGVGCEDALVGPLCPLCRLFLQRLHHFLHSLHGEDVIDARDIQSGQLQPCEAEGLDQAVASKIVEWAFQAGEVVVVDGGVGCLGEAVVRGEDVEVVRVGRQVLVGCELEVEVA